MPVQLETISAISSGYDLARSACASCILPFGFFVFQLLRGRSFLVADFRGTLKVLCVDGSRLFLLQLFQLILQLLAGRPAQCNARRRTREAASSMRSIALSGRIPVCDIPAEESSTAALMASSVIFTLWCASYSIAQALQNLYSLLLAGLANRDRLETALQGGVLFDIFAIFIDGCRADDLEFARAPAQVFKMFAASVAPSAAPAPMMVCSSSMNRMTSPDFWHFIHGGFDSFLKIAAVFGARNHSGQIERNDPFAFEQLRNLAGNNFQRKPFCNGSFTDAGFADRGRGYFWCGGKKSG